MERLAWIKIPYYNGNINDGEWWIWFCKISTGPNQETCPRVACVRCKKFVKHVKWLPESFQHSSGPRISGLVHLNECRIVATFQFGRQRLTLPSEQQSGRPEHGFSVENTMPNENCAEYFINLCKYYASLTVRLCDWTTRARLLIRTSIVAAVNGSSNQCEMLFIQKMSLLPEIRLHFIMSESRKMKLHTDIHSQSLAEASVTIDWMHKFISMAWQNDHLSNF